MVLFSDILLLSILNSLSQIGSIPVFVISSIFANGGKSVCKRVSKFSISFLSPSTSIITASPVFLTNPAKWSFFANL